MEAKAREAEERVLHSPSRDEALKNAILAAETYMKAIKLASGASERERLKSKCMQILARAEEIKQVETWRMPEDQSKRAESIYTLTAPLSDRAFPTREQLILLESSKLHGFIFSPWTTEPGEELFQPLGAGSFIDSPELKLSDSQRRYFAGWRRPDELFRDRHRVDGVPETTTQSTMIARNNIDLVQDVIADCSLVASLCAAVAQPGHTFEKLLSTIFYPYDKKNSRPMISSSGRYIFRFHFNGCYRKVVVDDRLPASTSSRTLHVIDRQNPGLLWPALLEKAYLKMRGGYDFPGSNSGTDLHVLTGWIPEQIFLQSDETDPQKLWRRIFKSYSFGDVILTLGTGRLSHSEEEGLGLAGEHDYAVLDMKEVSGEQLILMKNPWCDGTIWKGPESTGARNEQLEGTCADRDKTHATENSDTPPSTFWMDFNQVTRNFESLYLNWNPGLFQFRQDHHFSWAIHNPGSSAYFTHNPQYSINSVKGGPVWVLLSRHFSTEERDIISSSIHNKVSRSPLGFISLYVCNTNGRRVHSSDTILRGPFVDSPQTLIRLDMPAMTSYTLVVMQQSLAFSRYSFTLSVYSRDPATMDHASDIYPYHRSLIGAWTLRTAGGNASSPSYPSNPQFRMSIKSATHVVLLLETDQPALPIHVNMVWAGGERATAVTARDVLGESGEYRRGFALAEISNVPAGVYTIICSTFEQGQLGSFTLTVESTVQCEIKPIANEAAGRLNLRLPMLLMCDGVDRMLAPVGVSRLTSIKVIARHCGVTAGSYTRAKSPLKVVLEQGQGPNKVILASSCNGEFDDAPAGVRIVDVDVSPQTGGREGLWLVVERFGGAKSVDEIEVEVLSEAAIEVGAWGTGDG